MIPPERLRTKTRLDLARRDPAKAFGFRQYSAYSIRS
jgi:hypothetical protein